MPLQHGERRQTSAAILLLALFGGRGGSTRGCGRFVSAKLLDSKSASSTHFMKTGAELQMTLRHARSKLELLTSAVGCATVAAACVTLNAPAVEVVCALEAHPTRTMGACSDTIRVGTRCQSMENKRFDVSGVSGSQMCQSIRYSSSPPGAPATWQTSEAWVISRKRKGPEPSCPCHFFMPVHALPGFSWNRERKDLPPCPTRHQTGGKFAS